MKILVTVVTKNRNKLSEIRRILAPFGVEVCGMPDDYVGPEENGATYRDNAFLKLDAALSYFRSCPARPAPSLLMADDSGIEVDALNGFPGICSKRMLGAMGATKKEALATFEKIVGVAAAQRYAEMGGGYDARRASRRASYKCAIAISYDDPDPTHPLARRRASFSGECQGTILTEPAGSGGFDYDPLFMSDAGSVCFGTASPAEKDWVSHRGIAVREAACFIVSQCLCDKEGDGKNGPQKDR